MFGRKKHNLPAFTHAADCKVVKADPGVEIPWSEIRRGVWQAMCQCGKEFHHEAELDRRLPLDPLDPSVARPLPECEFASEADPAKLRLVLKVTQKDGYAWVECSGCACGWQVADFAEAR